MKNDKILVVERCCGCLRLRFRIKSLPNKDENWSEWYGCLTPQIANYFTLEPTEGLCPMCEKK